MSAKILVSVKGLKKWFPIKKGVFARTVGWTRAVDGVDLDIPAGKTLALVGESGCGKTTVGLTLLRLLMPTAGQIVYDGHDLTDLSEGRLKPFRRHMQVIFQDPYSSLNPRLTIGQTLLEGMGVHNIGATQDERVSQLRELLPKVGMPPDCMDRYPHEFSGGQRQRISIARVLAVRPSFIVCDEAVSALDVSVQAQILNLLKDLQAEMGLTFLFITHNLSVVEYLADEVAVMYLGKIVERAPSEALFGDPQHPYTRALLSSVPSLDPDHASQGQVLEGDVPSPSHPPSGCTFHPRCPCVFDRCSREAPALVPIGADHTSRCLLNEAGRRD